ncbi:DHA2 family efflux MFS transporter permease subunit [Actinomadura atramentaria]|uniref:DHA2 family efflux MFS transporter permease subunit n=1 Tax=Actinomadura atramentaria TaxID=1990 RepID=UPI0003725AA0|nr:DHA2 family efflux MFS transporter permease subunit [Actinomadura atramentaria]
MSETPSAAAPPGPPGASDRLDRGILVLGLVIVSGTIMAILDTTIVNVALKTLGHDFKTDLSTIQWVVTGYMLALGTVIPLTGWAVDRFGGRRVWMTSIVLFVAGSALSGAAWNIESLIVFRVLQGLGGGMLMPTGMAILSMAAGPRRMGRVMSIVGVPMLLGPILGPVIGGWLVDNADWRWIFLVNVPVGALALALAWWRIPAGEPHEGRAALDLRGLVLLPPAFALSIYGLSQANAHGFGSPDTYGWLAAGAVLIALFVAHSLQRGDRALIDVRLFADRTFATASVAVLLVGVALIGSLLLLPLYYQTARGETAFAAGLLLAPQGLGAALAMPVAGQLTDRLGAGRVVPFGIVLLTLGTIAFTQVSAGTSYWLLSGALFVRGLGLGATMMPTMSSAIATLPQRAVARATSSLNIIMQLGGSLGSALLAVLLSRQIGDRLPQASGSHGGFGDIPEAVRVKVAPLLAESFHAPFWLALGLTAALIVPALLLPRRGARHLPHEPAAEQVPEVAPHL